MTATLASTYEGKPAGYFSRPRTEIHPLLPSHLGRVLEVGCGDGATLVWLRDEHGATWTGGVELFPGPARLARRRVTELVEGDVEAMDPLPFAPASVDTVLCLDVLEHLRDPWTVVRRLTAVLRPGGALIASLPNLRHVGTLLPLIAGHFQYEDSGVRDRTHLRWFTHRTAQQLIASGGLVVDRAVSAAAYRGRLQWLRRLILPLGFGLLDRQILVRGVKR